MFFEVAVLELMEMPSDQFSNMLDVLAAMW